MSELITFDESFPSTVNIYNQIDLQLSLIYGCMYRRVYSKLVIPWVKVFSILTDFSLVFFDKGPDSS